MCNPRAGDTETRTVPATAHGLRGGTVTRVYGSSAEDCFPSLSTLHVCIRVCMCVSVCVCVCVRARARALVWCWKGQRQQSNRRLKHCEVPGSILKQTSWLPGCMFSCVCVCPPPKYREECLLCDICSTCLIILCCAEGSRKATGLVIQIWGDVVLSLFRLRAAFPSSTVDWKTKVCVCGDKGIKSEI